MGPISNTVNQLMNQQNNRLTTTTQNKATEGSQEGVLGTRPANVTSVAELMLFDTSTNVYEATKLTYVQETGAVFNIRGRKQKILSKKEREAIEQQKKLQIQKKAIAKAVEKKK